MENIKMEVKGDKLNIEIDLTKRGKISSSGKSISVASTSGNISIPGHEAIKIGVNCYTPK